MKSSTAFAVVRSCSRTAFGFLCAYPVTKLWYASSALADTLISVAMTILVRSRLSPSPFPDTESDHSIAPTQCFE